MCSSFRIVRFLDFRCEDVPGLRTRGCERGALLVGFTSKAERLDPEAVRGMLDPYYAQLRRELERHGGTVEKFIGDAVMAIFGAPVAHEDDPERAVRAALAIRDFAEEGAIELRIGITTG